MKAIFPGTFDPITNGHLDLIKRGSNLFAEVIVAVSTNTTKSPLLSLEERLFLIKKLTNNMPNITVLSFTGLLINCAKENGANTILRGLRSSDFDYEIQMADLNRTLAPDIDTIFLTATPQNSYISSSYVKEIAKFKGDISSFVDPIVSDILMNKYLNQ